MLFQTEQTYADGVVQRWADPPGDETAGAEEAAAKPAPSLGVTAEAAARQTPPPGSGGSGGGLWLGVIAIAIAAGAAGLSGLVWSSRPARLPEDEPGEADA